MDLATLRSLAVADQQVFLLGRIAAETTRLDAAARFLWGVLGGRREIGALLEAPTYFSSVIKECRTRIMERTDLSADVKRGLHTALSAATKVYAVRNRFIHDLLSGNLRERSWELMRISHPERDGAPLSVAVSFGEMVAIVLELVTVTWQLRGCALYALNGSFEAYVLGSVEGSWDGSATVTR